MPLGQEQPTRICETGQAVLAQLETAKLVCRAEPVLQRAHHPQLAARVAVEVQDDIDKVFKGAWSGNRAVLRYVANQNGGECALLRQRRQGRRDLPHLGDTTWH